MAERLIQPNINQQRALPAQNSPQSEFPVFGIIHDAMLLKGGIQERRDPKVKVRKAARTVFRESLHSDKRILAQLFDITHPSQLDQLRQDVNKREQIKTRATILIAGLYEIPQADADKTLEEYALLADSTVDAALHDMPPEIVRQGKESIVRQIHHPVDLILTATDQSVPQIDRYRSLRKVELIRTAAEVDFREREAQTQHAFEKFQDFLQNDVLDPVSEDDIKPRFVLSDHDTSSDGNFKTTATRIVTLEELEEMPELTHGQKLTPVRKRTFTVDSKTGEKQQLAVYIPDIRENNLLRIKSRESMILKSMRKNEAPTSAVDDQVGMMAVFEDPEHIYDFVRHLSTQATEAGSLFETQDIENTLNGGEHKTVSNGSSSDVHWYKAHFRTFGIRPEFIGFTPALLTHYLYTRGVSHREYTTSRLFKDDLMQRLIAHERFGYDAHAAQVYAERKVRSEIEDPHQINGYPGKTIVKLP